MKFNRVMVALIVLAILIRAPMIFRSLAYSHSDHWRQADTASIARFFYRDGFHLLYPQIYWGGDGAGYVETEFQLLPFITALLYVPFGEQLWLGRLVSFLFTIPTLIIIYLLAKRVTDKQTALGALFFIAISPLSIRYSTAFMPEAAAFCFYSGALYLFYCWIDDQRPTQLYAAGVCAALAILIKPTAIQIGLVFLLLLVECFRLRWLTRSSLWLFGIICLVPGALWFTHARNLYLTYGNTFGLFSGGDSKFGDLATWLSPFFYYQLALLDTEWIFGWVGILVFTAGIITLRKRPLRFVVYGLLTTLVYYMIVARYARQPWGIQYHIYVLPFAAIGVGAALKKLFEHSVVQSVVVISFLLVGTGYVYATLWQPTNENLVMCGLQALSLIPQDALIIVSTTSVANDNGTPNNYQEPQIFFYSDRRGWSLPADWHEPSYLDEFRSRGAQFFIIYNRRLYEENPALIEYLAGNAEQIASQTTTACAIYKFD